MFLTLALVFAGGCSLVGAAPCEVNDHCARDSECAFGFCRLAIAPDAGPPPPDAGPPPDADFVVDTTEDAPDAVADGICATAGGECSLRAALTEASAAPGLTNVFAPAGVYPARLGPFVVSGEVSLTGAGVDSTRLDGELDGPILEAATLDLELRDLEITRARVDGPAVGHPGAVFVDGGDLLVQRVRFLDNSTTAPDASFRGGALSCIRATRVDIEDSVFERNAIINRHSGGALAVQDSGAVFIRRTVFRDNRSDHYGGALFVSDVAVDIRDSLFDRNLAADDASAIDLGLAGTLLTENVTFTGNGGPSLIRAFFVWSVELRFNTFAELDSPLFAVSDGSTAVFANNLISAGSDATANLCVGASLELISQGGNIGLRIDECDLSSASDLLEDPLHGQLQDNGGPTPTMGLGPNSPALGAAAGACPATDARGVPRPATGCDSGAFEAP